MGPAPFGAVLAIRGGGAQSFLAGFGMPVVEGGAGVLWCCRVSGPFFVEWLWANWGNGGAATAYLTPVAWIFAIEVGGWSLTQGVGRVKLGSGSGLVTVYIDKLRSFQNPTTIPIRHFREQGQHF